MVKRLASAEGLCQIQIINQTFGFLQADDISFKSCFLETTKGLIQEHIRHLIAHLKKEANWLYIQRRRQIGYPFEERGKLAVNW